MKTNIKIFAINPDPTAVVQTYELAKTPAFSDQKIRIMPDMHTGKGCVIGFTGTFGNKVIPNIVGVDIGCGVSVTCIGEQTIDFPKLDEVIRKYVPSGFKTHDAQTAPFPKLEELKCFKHLKNMSHIKQSIGTLGGGNHFIEIDEDGCGNKYLIIHSGSRNLGKQVAEYYQNLAIARHDINHKERQRLIHDLKSAGLESEIQETLKSMKAEPKIPKECCDLGGDASKNYLHDMQIAQEYAALNRKTMRDIILAKMKWSALESFETVHNYIDFSSAPPIIRKGAVSAKEGETLIIPLNMRDGCILATGKGNEDWNQSAPHGAGRLFSRSKAKEDIDLETFKKSMDGVYSTCISRATLDESPQAYKPIAQILDAIGETVEINAIMKPIYNFKAS